METSVSQPARPCHLISHLVRVACAEASRCGTRSVLCPAPRFLRISLAACRATNRRPVKPCPCEPARGQFDTRCTVALHLPAPPSIDLAYLLSQRPCRLHAVHCLPAHFYSISDLPYAYARAAIACDMTAANRPAMSCGSCLAVSMPVRIFLIPTPTSALPVVD